MKMRYFETRKARIEIIPMIDVMLFLLVFFIIVTLQMIPDKGVNIQLPVSSQTDPLPHPKFIINILPDGSIKVKDNVISADDLTTMLAADGNPDQTEITIVADKTVPFQHFMTVVDHARKAGVTDIGIAAQPDADAP
jgi:biopolymer transport protein ExbD